MSLQFTVSKEPVATVEINNIVTVTLEVSRRKSTWNTVLEALLFIEDTYEYLSPDKHAKSLQRFSSDEDIDVVGYFYKLDLDFVIEKYPHIII